MAPPLPAVMPSVRIVVVGRVLPVAVPAASAAVPAVRMPSAAATGPTPSIVMPTAVRLASIAAAATVRTVSAAASIRPVATAI